MEENTRPESCLKKEKLKNRAVVINPNLVQKVSSQAHMRELVVPADCLLDTHFGPKVLEGYNDE
ncbi:4463_t:CDS:1, partial [Dentiscutata heterogama]